MARQTRIWRKLGIWQICTDVPEFNIERTRAPRFRSGAIYRSQATIAEFHDATTP